MLLVFKSSVSLDFEALFKLPMQQIDFDWFGERAKNPPKFVMAADPDRLLFGVYVQSSPWYEASARKGDFVEGLWNKDVGEFFVANNGAAEYQEFNLSPTGAWWSCSFSKYRKRSPEKFKTPQGVETYSSIEPSSWRAAMAVPLSQFSVPLSLEDSTRINACFALGKARRQYFTWANLQNRDPDFHKTEDFEDIDLDLI